MIFSIFYVISKNKTKIRIILFILYINLFLDIIYFYINLIYNLYLITNIHYISIFFPPYRIGIVSSSKSLNKASLISLKSYPTNVIYIILLLILFQQFL